MQGPAGLKMDGQGRAGMCRARPGMAGPGQKGQSRTGPCRAPGVGRALHKTSLCFCRDTLFIARNVIDRDGQKQNRFSLKYLFESQNLFLLL